TWNYGLFINTLINFLIVAFAVFLLIKQVNRLQKPAPVIASISKECPYCQTTIPVKATRCPNCTSQLETIP
ncbi:MAG: MscL family protein, partial [Leptolinea sp.]